MPATHVSGQDYEYVFDSEQDTPTFHFPRNCVGSEDYDSDMTKSAAVAATLDGEMEPCQICTSGFPIELHDKSITEIDLERGGWFSVGTKKATLKPEIDVDDLHRDVYRELANRGMRME